MSKRLRRILFTIAELERARDQLPDYSFYFRSFRRVSNELFGHPGHAQGLRDALVREGMVKTQRPEHAVFFRYRAIK